MEDEEAFITLLYNDQYLPGALVLGYRLKELQHQNEVVIMVTDKVSEESKSELKRVYDRLIMVPTLHNTNANSIEFKLLNRPELVDTFTKIYLWNQTQYSKLIFLDSDILILKNINELFDIDLKNGTTEIAAAPDIGWPDIFNSGVFITKPDYDIYIQLMELAERNESFDGGDQGLLNQFFLSRNTWQRIPFLYNVTPSSFYQYIPAYRYFKSQISIIHFAGMKKPWEGGDDSHGGSLTAVDDYFFQWRQMAGRFGVAIKGVNLEQLSIDSDNNNHDQGPAGVDARFDAYGGYTESDMILEPPVTRWDATKTPPPLINNDGEGENLDFENYPNAWDEGQAEEEEEEEENEEGEVYNYDNIKMILGPSVIKFPWENDADRPPVERYFPQPPPIRIDNNDNDHEDVYEPVINESPPYGDDDNDGDSSQEDEISDDMSHLINAWDEHPGIRKYMNKQTATTHVHVVKPHREQPRSQHAASSSSHEPDNTKTPKKGILKNSKEQRGDIPVKAPMTTKEKRNKIEEDLNDDDDGSLSSENDEVWDPQKKLQELAEMPGILLAKAKEAEAAANRKQQEEDNVEEPTQD